MENKLLDFYNTHILIDPRIDPAGKEMDSMKELQYSSVSFLSSIFTNSMSCMITYIDYSNSRFPDCFKSVSGNKIIKVDSCYVGIIDLWYPNEVCLFNIIRNPIMAGWIIEDLLKLPGIREIKSIFSVPDPYKLLEDSIKRLLEVIKGQEFWGFWLGNARNNIKKRPLKLRKLEVVKIEINKSVYRGGWWDLYPDLILYDSKHHETIKLNSQDNKMGEWNFYLSRELMESRLTDLESFWMRGYDSRVKEIDNGIRAKRKELENLIKKRSCFENGINEFKNKLHEILWKDC